MNNSYGEARPKVYNDLAGISEVREIINASPKRIVDQLITNLSTSQPCVRTAIVYGPMIYGEGRGPVNQRSIQIPDLANATLKHGQGFHVGKGLSTWSHVHISDITRLIVSLVSEASSSINQPLWNATGIYFPEAGRMVGH